MKIRKCLECGQEFMPNSGAQKFCKRDHYRTCAICGKSFLVPFEKLSDLQRVAPTCSKECLNKAKGLLSKQSKETSPKYDKVCEACGKPFKTSNSNQRFCNRDHKVKCSVCGREFVANHTQLASGKLTCSDECRYIQSQQTYHSNFDKDINPEAHNDMIERTRQTTFERNGFYNSLSSDGNAREKFKEKYGVDHPMHCNEIKKKRSETNLRKYGSGSPLSDSAIRAKSIETCIQKYGVDNYARSEFFLKQVISEPDKSDDCKMFRNNPREYILSNFPNTMPTLKDISEKCGIRDSSVGWILDKAECKDIVRYTYSRMEDEVYMFLRNEIGNSAKIERNTFKVITPYELDIYLPDYQFAIECDPTITHNSTIPGWSQEDKPKSSNYHKMKTDMCEDKGIFLFHIFGYDWSNRKEIIKSMIRNVLRTSRSTIYARKTTIRNVSDKDCSDFLNENHRQGSTHSKIRLGLYSDDELVSVMTFSKMRPTIGKTSSQEENCYELVRFCSKLNTSVVGGASKLFKHFLNQYNPSEIRSFSDRAHTQGSLYQLLGFKYDHTADPGYMWVDLKTDKGFSRNNAQKSNIKKFLNDDTIDSSKTEVQIMSEHNFVQVFDSGVKLWIWRKTTDEHNN